MGLGMEVSGLDGRGLDNNTGYLVLWMFSEMVDELL